MDIQDKDEALTKHEWILRHIEGLKVGTKISVRQIAREMEVSEGTAYRAIKEAETLGLISTKERIGSVRIEKKERHNIDKLTFAEVANIVDGEVLGGSEGLDKTLSKFVIGAMQQEAMLRYIEPGNLLIVGNRDKAHLCALEQGAAVLITGGFSASDEVVKLADELALPIISSSYDTFTVASMINRAIYDRLIKKKIMLVQDILSPESVVYALKYGSRVKDWRKLIEETGHNRFPVVDEWNRVVGMVTSKDMVDARQEQTIDKLMTRNPITIHQHASVASAAHLMVWEGIELLPVVDQNRKMIGVISRKDVLKVMQYISRQPQIGETFEDLIWSGFEECRDETGALCMRGTVTPQMTNRLGSVSSGVLTMLMTQAAYRLIQDYRKGDLVIDNVTTYFLHPVQMEREIVIRPRLIEVSRKFGKIDIEVYDGDRLAGKAMLTAQVFDQ
ncbi:thioesterase [Paenibacillus sp. J31TS4]|uniref:DRTGG domain-containing protein n=1 Tax=Paenibacillus sp. J31TS4 TaxID=2807195 RepID=UPI001AFEAC12|nr:DRTGG domain-containing protein [Paenibacillus sp. J31TS4]GIP38258.1 thioesterase [Paenibacillus sp. J31TS4]